jgi:hypothetical protein
LNEIRKTMQDIKEFNKDTEILKKRNWNTENEKLKKPD